MTSSVIESSLLLLWAAVAVTSTSALTEWRSFNVTPNNTAGYVGDDVTLYCTLRDYTTGFQEWTEYVTSPQGAGIRISLNDNIYHPNTNHYTIIDYYHLVIRNITHDDAGIYSCFDEYDDAYVFVHLLVLDEVTCAAGGHLTILEASNILLCDVSGAGAWPPVVNVTFINYDLDTSYAVVNSSAGGNTFSLAAVKVANRTLNNATVQYACDVYFSEPGSAVPDDDSDNRLWARNAPSLLDDSCLQSYLLDVQYFSGNIRFLINNMFYESQANLTLSTQPEKVECISDANPPVNCTVEVKAVQDGNTLKACSWNTAAEDCSTGPCDFDCTVGNSINPNGVEALFSFIVIK